MEASKVLGQCSDTFSMIIESFSFTMLFKVAHEDTKIVLPVEVTCNSVTSLQKNTPTWADMCSQLASNFNLATNFVPVLSISDNHSTVTSMCLCNRTFVLR